MTLWPNQSGGGAHILHLVKEAKQDASALHEHCHLPNVHYMPLSVTINVHPSNSLPLSLLGRGKCRRIHGRMPICICVLRETSMDPDAPRPFAS